MTTYLVDFENTHVAGLDGLAGLTSDDVLVIFVGVKNKTIPVEAVIKMTNIGFPAKIKWKRCEGTAPNYLDFQLVSYLGYLLGSSKNNQSHYVIVTRDTGFDSVIDFWKPRRADVKIERRPALFGVQTPSDISPENKPKSIPPKPDLKVGSKKKPATNGSGNTDQKALPEAWKKKIRAAVSTIGIQPAHYTTLYQAFLTSKELPQIQSAIDKSVAQSKRAETLKAVSPLFLEFRKSVPLG
ncbi:PIN domain-containing protein [Jonesia quinghaiensis]|uniref:PIN domain-containing protein n=1 Tax=Jonesia quinghaiensis TaxID=262806 RepID=UPI00048BC3CA|nr:PIN domain-containing protein [Jonesia quinghaiensis]